MRQLRRGPVPNNKWTGEGDGPYLAGSPAAVMNTDLLTVYDALVLLLQASPVYCDFCFDGDLGTNVFILYL